jgi:hypothetical protein
LIQIQYNPGAASPSASLTATEIRERAERKAKKAAESNANNENMGLTLGFLESANPVGRTSEGGVRSG